MLRAKPARHPPGGGVGLLEGGRAHRQGSGLREGFSRLMSEPGLWWVARRVPGVCQATRDVHRPLQSDLAIWPARTICRSALAS